jgi:NitT/TauT family transport system substrate-binding protein
VRTHPRRFAALSLALGVGLLAAACGGSDDDAGDTAGDTDERVVPVSLQLQWSAQAQFAGYYAALGEGYFIDEGLDVELVEGGVDIVPQIQLATGAADFAIAWVPKALESRATDAAITNVAQVFQRSATTQVSWADSEIDSVEDLEGKNIGSWGFGNQYELAAALKNAGLPYQDDAFIQQNFDMQALLNREIDAAQAMTYNEYAMLLETMNPETGELYQPEDFNVISYQDTAGAMLQDAIWADTERLESDEEYAETAVAFLKAVVKGWVFARDNPEEAAEITLASGSAWGPSHELWMMNETNKLIWPSPDGIGIIDEAAWQRTVDGALAAVNETGAHLITAEPPATAWSNEYIQQALDELTEEGIDLTGESFEPIEVVLQEGGN